MSRRLRGFTLVELSIVLVIIGLIMVAVFKGEALIGVSGSQATLAAVKDLSTAIAQFRDRYGYLPGDMPNATTQILTVANGGCADGNGDGNIDVGEVACVPWHLFNAGFIKGGTGTITLIVSGKSVTIRAIARAASGVAGFPTSTRNVIELLNLPCQQAIDLDNKSDDGFFATGNTRATVVAGVTNCVPIGSPGAANDPVPSVAVAL